MPSEWPRSALDHAPASGGAAPSAQGPTRSRTPHPSYQRRHRNELSGRRRRSVLRVCHATKAWAAVLLPQGREAAQLPANAQRGGVKSASPHHRGRTRRRQCRADWPGPGGQPRQSETLRNGVGRAPAAHQDGGPRCRTTAASPHNCALLPARWLLRSQGVPATTRRPQPPAGVHPPTAGAFVISDISETAPLREYSSSSAAPTPSSAGWAAPRAAQQLAPSPRR